MRTIIATLMTVSVAITALPLVHADETKADCEPGQAWIGYGQTDAARALYYSLVAPGDPRISGACEGEHWDGQDTAGSYDPGSASTATCTSPSVTGTTATVASCMGPDINNGGASIPAKPLATRASATAGTGGAATYIGLDIPLVGRVATYQGVCVTGGSIEGLACAGKVGTRSAIYLRDNTNQATGGQDALANAVSTTGITKGHASEADCTQEEYERGARSGDKSICGRDNTAITIETLLP